MAKVPTKFDIGSNMDEETTIEPVAPKVVAAAEKRVKIVLDDNDDIPPTGLFVGFNGRGFMLRTNVELNVPVGVVHILENAVTNAPVIDPQTRRYSGFRPRQRFAFRYVDNRHDPRNHAA